MTMRKENAMPRPRPALAIVALVLAAAIAAPAIAGGVKVDFDKEADFTKRKTWAWKAGTEAPNPLTEQKIRMAVERNLRAKGLQKVETSPDLWVVTHTSVTSEARINVETFGYGGMYGWNGWNAWGPATTVRIDDNETGVLLVDILDGPGAKLIWRGIASEKVPDLPDPDKVEKKVNAAVAKMFKEFPPPPPAPPKK
jgi:uncharacterized protein DUF4136